MPLKSTSAQPLAANGTARNGCAPTSRGRRAVLTRDERTAAGKAARDTVRRQRLGAWAAPAGRPDPVEVLTSQAAGRLPELVPLRNGRMLASPFAFYRGAAAVMAGDLATTPVSGLTVQLCGDAHLSNFGGYASPERNLVFDLNDFDETIPGPWEWDVKRLVASLAVAGRDRGLARPERRRLVERSATAYREAMRQYAGMGTLDVWYSSMSMDTILDRWLDRVSPKDSRGFERRIRKAMGKDSVSAAARHTRLVDGERRMVSAPPLLVPVADLFGPQDRLTFERAVEGALRLYSRSLTGDRRHLLQQFRFVDMARKVVGVGSVGTRCWVLLFCGVDGEDPLMLQVKEARESVLAPYVTKSRYTNQGQRVVEGQRLMQASSDVFLGWSRGRAVDGEERDFYVRQLWDWKVSSDPAAASVQNLSVLAQMCGRTLARAHACSGDRVALAAYLGGGPAFDRAMGEFAESYADQNERDFEVFARAADAGRIEVQADI